MTNTPSPAEMEVRPMREGILARLSFVWIVPVVALVISLGVAWQNFTSRGPLIEISFSSASGITAGETVLKYRDVTVGRVEDVSFDEGLGDVLVNVRVNKDIAPYLDDDAVFWVVQPNVSLRGISGLDTVLSGVYIAGDWDREADVAQSQFIGLEDTPALAPNRPGTQITLRARNAEALSEGVPVLHKGIRVGYIDQPELGPDGESVISTAFINAPYDRLITDETRFWATSAFSINVNTSGLSVDVASLASLLEGGIEFDTVVSGGEPLGDDPVFDIFENATVASESLFSDPDLPTFDLAVLFDGTIAGLRRGSEVRFKGVRVGQVNEISAVVVDDANDQLAVDLRAVLGVEPARMGLPEDASDEEVRAFFDTLVTNGLRARLVTGSLLSGALTVELLQLDDAPAVDFDPAGDPYPVLPTTDNLITDVTATAEGVLQRIQSLPIEDVFNSAINLMNAVEDVARNEDLQQAPGSLVALLDEARALVASEDIQAIPADLRGVISGVGNIVLSAEEAQLVTQLDAALSTANVTLANVAQGTANLPALSAEAEALLAKVNALQLAALLTQTENTLNAAEVLLSGEDMQALPGAVNGLLTEGQTTLAEARALIASDDLQAIPGDIRGVIANVDGIVLSAQDAQLVAQLSDTLTAANAAATNVAAGTENLSALSAEAEALIAKLNALEVESLLTQTESTLNSVDVLVRGEDMQALPGTLNDLLDQANGTLGEARTILASDDLQNLPGQLSAVIVDLNGIVADIAEADLVAQVQTAITNANAAISNVNDATAGLPAIAEELRALTQTANELELQALVDQTQGTLSSIQAIMDQTETQALPGSVAAALDELRLLLADVNEGGAIANVNAALASANQAAQAIETAAEGLPGLSDRAAVLFNSVDGVIATYGAGQRFNAETLATLRDVQAAADAISNLARTIQRNPSSLLTGR